MLLGMEIGLAIWGILGLVRGRMVITKAKEVRGVPARLLGALALTPLPVALLVVLVVTLLSADANDPAAVEKWVSENHGLITLIEAGVVIGIGLLVIIIGACIAQPIDTRPRRARRRPDDDYDDYEPDPRDRPRRRRDEDEDRPRRRRDADDDYDDRPRRRRDDY